MNDRPILLMVVTEDWDFASHRLPVARAAIRQGYRVVLATRVGKDAPRLEAEGIELAALQWSRGGLAVNRELQSIFQLAALYRRLKPDVVHLVSHKPILYGTAAAMLAGQREIVNAVTGVGSVFIGTTAKARVLRPFVKAALGVALRRKGSVSLFQNRDDRELFLGPGAEKSERQALIKGSGVDLSEFPFSRIPAGIPLVLLPARLLWDKGVGEFVAAARLLKARGVQARFALIGESDPANPATTPREEVARWHAEGVIEAWGYRADMPAVLAQSTIVCLPSYREGVPKALLEALAVGRPIVTTDAPGCREVVAPGENGLLVPVRSVEPLADALERILKDPELARIMGERSRAMAEQQFSVDSVAAATLALYEKVLRPERARLLRPTRAAPLPGNPAKSLVNEQTC